ncbi:hypothetical protein BLNAU_2762 [Blattamonas nauphoetae]|uniref:PH domain-containing protein n=1 Tax=Blattamonas nauphoetae TaxID=2049346 RepID=A0ABQ9YEB1_9EUKA|nr:hypothetical protein BLNAU_2762 [Blattamonas nauphoetae]
MVPLVLLLRERERIQAQESFSRTVGPSSRLATEKSPQKVSVLAPNEVEIEENPILTKLLEQQETVLNIAKGKVDSTKSMKKSQFTPELVSFDALRDSMFTTTPQNERTSITLIPIIDNPLLSQRTTSFVRAYLRSALTLSSQRILTTSGHYQSKNIPILSLPFECAFLSKGTYTIKIGHTGTSAIYHLSIDGFKDKEAPTPSFTTLAIPKQPSTHTSLPPQRKVFHGLKWRQSSGAQPIGECHLSDIVQIRCFPRIEDNSDERSYEVSGFLSESTFISRWNRLTENAPTKQSTLLDSSPSQCLIELQRKEPQFPLLFVFSSASEMENWVMGICQAHSLYHAMVAVALKNEKG